MRMIALGGWVVAMLAAASLGAAGESALVQAVTSRVIQSASLLM